MKVFMTKAKSRLAILWFSAFFLLFALLIMQTISGTYGEHNAEAWSWFLPTIFPTLSLIIAVFVSDARGLSKQVEYVDKFFYRLTFSLSLFYLLCVFIIIVAQVFSEQWPLDFLKHSNVFLGPLQGLTAGAMVVFFRLKESQS
jgi:hypothetical protein